MNAQWIKLFPAIAAIFALLTGCAAAQPDLRQKLTSDCLTVAAYERVVPRLTELRPGDRIESKIELKLFPILQGRKRVDTVAVSDGWVSAFSGSALGAATGFGRFVGQTGDVLIGQHVFGYLFERGMLVPQYTITTQALVISQDEYNQKQHDASGFIILAEGGPPLYFKNSTVMEIRKLKFKGPESLEGANRIGDPISLKSFGTIERFHEADKKLNSLTPGTDFWDALFALNMSIVTFDSGVTFRAWFADGYLGKPWQKLTSRGNFEIFRFGYLEGDHEIPKLALIFKNSRVHRVVPYGTQEEMEQSFN
jgi:hypothetical protein